MARTRARRADERASTPRPLAVGAALLLATLLAACGSADAAHVIGPAASPATGPVKLALPGPGAGHPAAAQSTPAGSLLSAASLSQIDNQLQELSSSLTQVSSDLSRAQRGA